MVKAEDRYIYAEVEDSLTGAVDDVEFLFSLSTPTVGYRSSPRRGNDDNRRRRRALALAPKPIPNACPARGRARGRAPAHALTLTTRRQRNRIREIRKSLQSKGEPPLPPPPRASPRPVRCSLCSRGRHPPPCALPQAGRVSAGSSSSEVVRERF